MSTLNKWVWLFAVILYEGLPNSHWGRLNVVISVDYYSVFHIFVFLHLCVMVCGRVYGHGAWVCRGYENSCFSIDNICKLLSADVIHIECRYSNIQELFFMEYYSWSLCYTCLVERGVVYRGLGVTGKGVFMTTIFMVCLNSESMHMSILFVYGGGSMCTNCIG